MLNVIQSLRKKIIILQQRYKKKKKSCWKFDLKKTNMFFRIKLLNK